MLSSGRQLGLELTLDNDNGWVIEHENPEELSASIHNTLKSKIVSNKTNTALDMLDGCELSEVPIRALYVLDLILTDN